MPIDDVGGTEAIRGFVRRVAAFKRAVDAGDIESPSVKEAAHLLKAFYKEGRGARSGRHAGTIEYVSRHGDVVDALHEWLVARGTKGTARKNVLIDLAIESRGVMTDLFEVKTSDGRTDIYTAIGQLMTHARGDRCRKHIVLPEGPVLPGDITAALTRLDVDVIRYGMDRHGKIHIAA